MEHIPLPTAKFAHVHVVLVGPLLVSTNGHKHLLTVVDRCSRWPEVIPKRSTNAEACADAFALNRATNYGVLHIITTYKVVQFTLAVWKCLCRTLGTHRILTTAYRPEKTAWWSAFTAS